MDDRPAKKPRTSRPEVYRDAVPVFQDFDTVLSTEASVSRRGNLIQATRPPARTTEPVLGVWETVVNWEPVDDPEYALDPDGEWYDEALEADVMAEKPVKPKAKRSMTSVSDIGDCI